MLGFYTHACLGLLRLYALVFLPVARHLLCFLPSFREKQDKIALGLMPAPEPKLKIGNFMQVLYCTHFTALSANIIMLMHVEPLSRNVFSDITFFLCLIYYNVK